MFLLLKNNTRINWALASQFDTNCFTNHKNYNQSYSPKIMQSEDQHLALYHQFLLLKNKKSQMILIKEIQYNEKFVVVFIIQNLLLHQFNPNLSKLEVED